MLWYQSQTADLVDTLLPPTLNPPPPCKASIYFFSGSFSSKENILPLRITRTRSLCHVLHYWRDINFIADVISTSISLMVYSDTTMRGKSLVFLTLDRCVVYVESENLTSENDDGNLFWPLRTTTTPSSTCQNTKHTMTPGERIAHVQSVAAQDRRRVEGRCASDTPTVQLLQPPSKQMTRLSNHCYGCWTLMKEEEGGFCS